MMNLSNHLICTACNNIGCDSVNERTLVYIKQFIIHVSRKEISVGEEVTLECIALRNFASEVHWQTENHLSQYLESGEKCYLEYEINGFICLKKLLTFQFYLYRSSKNTQCTFSYSSSYSFNNK